MSKTKTENRDRNLTPCQSVALKAFLEGNNWETTAKIAGCHVSSITRWMRLPAFREAINDATNLGFSEAGTRLSGSAYRAACTLDRVMMDESTKPEVKVKAALEILNYALKLSENMDLQNRIRLLEQAAAVDVDGEDE